MSPWMSGPKQRDGISSMCIGAKVCTGKAKDEEAAKKLCLEAAANPKAPKASRKSKIDIEAIAACAATKIDIDKLTYDNIVPTIKAAIQLCGGGGSKTAKAPSYKRFMHLCLKKSGVDDFRKSGPDIKECQREWKATGGL